MKTQPVKIVISTYCYEDVSEKDAALALFAGTPLAFGESDDEDVVSFATEDTDAEEELAAPTPKRTAPTVLSTSGMLTADRHTTTLAYAESPLMHLQGSLTQFRFNPQNPDEVTMLRTGKTTTNLIFDLKKRRRLCHYNNSYLSFDVAVVTEHMKNTISFDRGGTLEVNYSVETHGLPLERNRISISVTPFSSADSAPTAQ